jgi:succinate dehydrogenase/fumarate reductase flavoprotein subunit
MCGGYSAAAKAFEYVRKNKQTLALDTNRVAEEKERVFAPQKRKNGYSWREYEDVIRQIMNYYMGYMRNQKGMELALEKLSKMEEHVGEITAGNFHELLRANEVMHLVSYCQLAVTSALERKESGRNCYIRSDYPSIDPSWDGKEIIQWKEGSASKIVVQRIEE